MRRVRKKEREGRQTDLCNMRIFVLLPITTIRFHFAVDLTDVAPVLSFCLSITLFVDLDLEFCLNFTSQLRCDLFLSQLLRLFFSIQFDFFCFCYLLVGRMRDVVSKQRWLHFYKFSYFFSNELRKWTNTQEQVRSANTQSPHTFLSRSLINNNNNKKINMIYTLMHSAHTHK